MSTNEGHDIFSLAFIFISFVARSVCSTLYVCAWIIFDADMFGIYRVFCVFIQ